MNRMFKCEIRLLRKITANYFEVISVNYGNLIIFNDEHMEAVLTFDFIEIIRNKTDEKFLDMNFYVANPENKVTKMYFSMSILKDDFQIPLTLEFPQYSIYVTKIDIIDEIKDMEEKKKIQEYHDYFKNTFYTKGQKGD